MVGPRNATQAKVELEPFQYLNIGIRYLSFALRKRLNRNGVVRGHGAASKRWLLTAQVRQAAHSELWFEEMRGVQ